MSPFRRVFLGLVLLGMGSPVGAQSDRVGEMTPDPPPVRELPLPGMADLRAGRYAEAIQQLQAALRGAPTPTRAVSAAGYQAIAFAGTMLGASGTAIAAAIRAEDLAVRDPLLPELQPLAALVPLTLVAFDKWDEILAEPLPSPTQAVARGLAYQARGMAFVGLRRWAEARAALDSVAASASRATGDDRQLLEVGEYVLAGTLALERGQRTNAIRLLRAAVKTEDGLTATTPPRWPLPTRLVLGAALLRAQRAAEAESTFRDALERWPENRWALRGLRRAIVMQGRSPALRTPDRPPG